MNNNMSFESQTAQSSVNMVFCRSCGSQIRQEAEICPRCGVRQLPPPTETLGDKNRIAAGVLALLLGGLGVHKFYMGQVGKGILYLLFVWTFIPSILALIEGICILVETDAKFARRLNA
ncbi:TM2 [Syntrophomonas zehnderi OL-4]|uniref:TM2 n=1 Tax=Syntrophomonas zehnderi OL-4 TaxID=690567 RepID=A0A0E4GAM0_9FIRM|nr:TM2 domain-containing protein [Syntrophomonas zehnderi]CFX15822.1 TM2 [Syntrophomonas zehnderi OL-4]